MSESWRFIDKLTGTAVEVDPVAGIFRPTDTTTLLLTAAIDQFRKLGVQSWESPRILDLGCGSGINAVTLKLLFPSAHVFGSDTSKPAVDHAQSVAQRYGINIDFRVGSIFEPWRNEEPFNMIIDDISGVAEIPARISGWYPDGVPCDSGADGADLVVLMLKSVRRHLKEEGSLVFPVLTLSNWKRILARASKFFLSVKKIGDRRFFLKDALLDQREKYWFLVRKELLQIYEYRGKWWWHTWIYTATNGKTT